MSSPSHGTAGLTGRRRDVRRTDTDRHAVESLEPRALLAAALVRDINPTTFDSEPTAGVEFHSAVYFAARSDAVPPEFGGTLAGRYELWRSDLATGDTTFVKAFDSQPIPPPAFVADPRDDRFFFTASHNSSGIPGTGSPWVWSSNGTTEGTVPLHQADSPVIMPDSSQPTVPNLINLNGAIFFSSAQSLWKTDGTPAGTVPVKSVWADLFPGVNACVAGETLYFASVAPSGVWTSDGTPEGTVMLRSFPQPQPSSFTAVGNTAYFVAVGAQQGRELWKTDGTPEGTVLVKDVRPGTGSSNPAGLVAVGDTLYFVADDGQSGRELWKTDGTDAGTVRVRDVNPGAASAGIARPVNVGGTLFFFANDGVNGQELWKTDGTGSGTVMVADVNPGPAGSAPDKARPRDAAAAGGLLYFAANDGTSGTELWKSDGTAAGTALVEDLAVGPAGSGPSQMLWTSVGRLCFVATDPVTGAEPYLSDGTGAGTVLARDVNANTASSISHTAPYPQRVTLPDGSLLFAANGGTTGVELWRSDGTAGGTRLVRDIYPGPARPASPVEAPGPTELTVFNDTVYFAANDGVAGRELWRTDGTPEGTALVTDLVPGAASADPRGLIDVAGSLYFWAGDGARTASLYKTDGTADGTVLVKDVSSLSPTARPVAQVAYGGRLYTYASDNRLWRSDGTEAGTTALASPSNFGLFLPLPDALLFTAGSTLYRIDGDQITNVGPGGESAAVAAGRIFFRRGDGGTAAANTELWTSDGTAAGTRKLKEIRPGPTGSFPTNLRAAGDELLFLADDGVHGFELWRSDGTEAGTVMVADVNPGAPGSHATPWYTGTTAGAYFTATDAATGRELWFTDGTPDGTFLVADAAPGADSSTAFALADTPSGLFFDAFRRSTGRELWHADPLAADVAPVASIAAAPGPLAVGEGASIELYGYGPLGTASYEWDLDYDGRRFDADATGRVPTFSAAGLDGPSSRTVALRVTSAAGHTSAPATARVQILPVAPTLDLAGPATARAGTPFSVTLGSSDGGPDTISSWTVDWGDGAASTLIGADRTATHVYRGPPGLYNVTAAATDEDGTYQVLLHTPVIPDPTFGAGGVAEDPLRDRSGGNPLGVLQPDGKVIMILDGWAGTGAPESARTWRLTRFDALGRPDATFGDGGVVHTPMPGDVYFTWALAASPAPGGRFVVAGFADSRLTGRSFFFARYGPDGALDPSFGNGGIATLDMGNPRYFPYDIAVDASGRVVAAGSVADPGGTGGGQRFAVARLKADGSLDESFDGDGRLTFRPAADRPGEARAVALTPDGRIIVAGDARVSGGLRHVGAVARLNPDGSYDPTFGDDGIQFVDFVDAGARDAVPFDMVIQPDGRIVLAGGTTDGFPGNTPVTADWAVARLNPDGTPDPAFGGGDGITTWDLSGGYDHVRRVLLQADGRILLAGAGGGPDSSAVGRLLPDGTPDPTFNGTGRLVTRRAEACFPRWSSKRTANFSCSGGAAKRRPAATHRRPWCATSCRARPWSRRPPSSAATFSTTPARTTAAIRRRRRRTTPLWRPTSGLCSPGRRPGFPTSRAIRVGSTAS